ncbi:MAG: hypothetical protein IPH31_07460 [Lewinellaceae bacterium]|nr:hypothetical protein [Lewinellaceae bacterium]
MKGFNLFFRLSALAILLAATSYQTAAQCISGNCQNGTGTYRYSASSKYTGQFQNAVRHGKGKMSYSDGSVYDGPFNYGKNKAMGAPSPTLTGTSTLANGRATIPTARVSIISRPKNDSKATS